MPSWTEILNELNRDVAKEQPQDVVQFGADWFQTKLKQERSGSGKRGPGSLGALPRPGQDINPGSTLSPFSEMAPRDSPFGQPAPSLFSSSSPFGAAGDASPMAQDDDGGPNSGPPSRGMTFNNSPFGAPVEHHDEPPVPSYALGRRTSVSAESLVPQTHRQTGNNLESTLEEDEEPAATPYFPKTDEQLARIKTAIQPNFLFRNLDEGQEKDVLAAMKEVNIGANEMIIEQGAAGDYFYVVEKGTLDVYVKKEGQVIDADKGDSNLYGKKVATCKEGSSFGELALMHNRVHPFDFPLYSLGSGPSLFPDYPARQHTSRKRRLYEAFLSEVPILASLQPQERAKIADVLESRTFAEGQDVIREGDEGEEFFLIESGSAVAVKKQDGREVVVKQYTKGDYFGELALLNRQTRAASVRASGDKLVVAALGEQAFTRLLGPVKDIMARNVGERYGFAAGR